MIFVRLELFQNNQIRYVSVEINNILMFTHQTDIQLISLDVGYFVNVPLPLNGLQNAIASAFDVVEGELYIIVDQII